MKQAFKEWAVVCQALAEGRQALIIRKGGVAETVGAFQLEHARFWLYPTYTHQQRDGIRPDALPILAQVESDRPPLGTIRLSHFAEVTGVYLVNDLVRAMLLAHLHIWSDETVRKRFEYRAPGLHVMPVRVYRAATHDIPESPAYHGCRSWVDLDRDLSTEGAMPVLSDAAMEDLHRSLDVLLNPVALA
ncbi:MAG: DUF1802 family protein [Planctomycetes bacterium]|nr:DUF1802 family protein [Planctomycetota bacterium]